MTPVNPTTQPSKSAQGGGEQQTTEAAKVTISSQARELAEGGATPVNAKKVEALKAAIADGSFSINTHTVAQRMLEKAG